MMILNKLGSFFKSIDVVTKPTHTFLHYENDAHQKTIIGGVFSFLITLLVYDIGIEQGIRMLSYVKPDINT